MTSRRRILLVEDHPIMREGVAAWIDRQPDLQVCGQAGDASDAFGMLETLAPDLVVADLELPGRSGLELIKDISAFDPELPVLILSMHDETIFALRTLRAGAHGYVMKKAGGDELVAAIRAVLGGRKAFSSEVTQQVIEDVAGRRRGHRSPLAMLTDREFEIFQMIGSGRATKEIARQLNLSHKTVDAHRTNLRQKLKIKSLPELIRFSVEYSRGESGLPGGLP